MEKKLNRIISIIIVMAVVITSFCVFAHAEETVATEQTDQIAMVDDQTINPDAVIPQEMTEIAEPQEETEPQDIEIIEPDSVEPKVTDIAKTMEPDVQINTQVADTSVVGKVSTIYKDSKSTNQIHIYWNPVKNAVGYYVYMRNSDKSKDFTLLTTTSNTDVYVKNLTDTTPYQFKVSAYVVKDNLIYEGESAYLETATHPAAINSMTLKRCSSVISFSWKANPRATGYLVYRASYATGGKFKQYKYIKGGSNNSFEDKSIIKGRAYYYYVKAYRTPYKGRTYYGTGTTLKTVAGLAAPVAGKCTTQLRRVSLSWSRSSVAQGYLIYYSTSKTGTYKHLKTTANTFYNTPRLTNGKTYYFRVVPYRKIGTSVVRGTWMTCTKKISDKAFNKTIGNTYIEISLKQQRMWFYINGNLYCETPVVTGNDDGYHNTPRGAHKILQRSSPATLTGPDWNVNVTYWLGFTGSGCGIHDSTWRPSSDYGGTTYKGNGSHGCVNTPYSKVQKIYSKAKLGMYVVVY